MPAKVVLFVRVSPEAKAWVVAKGKHKDGKDVVTTGLAVERLIMNDKRKNLARRKKAA